MCVSRTRTPGTRFNGYATAPSIHAHYRYVGVSHDPLGMCDLINHIPTDQHRPRGGVRVVCGWCVGTGMREYVTVSGRSCTVDKWSKPFMEVSYTFVQSKTPKHTSICSLCTTTWRSGCRSRTPIRRHIQRISDLGGQWVQTAGPINHPIPPWGGAGALIPPLTPIQPPGLTAGCCVGGAHAWVCS